MHRQSLGSPSSKLVSKKDEQIISCEPQPKQLFPSQSSSSSGSSLFYEEEDADEAKKMMIRLKQKTNSTPETYIHLIPMLTLLCFLILYLSSHHISPNDLAQVNFPKTLSNPQELQGIMKGDILAIRSLKNLEQEAAGRAKHRLLHRKFARF
ncbi:hypothetical protein CASFOL_037014 [Castilleja foliolosa]|uniref:Uncharacterized protein n=1 Tax=Castilleja foliolosa TaxID=1961234 RepID=A0ABD3BQG3_9LAMI